MYKKFLIHPAFFRTGKSLLNSSADCRTSSVWQCFRNMSRSGAHNALPPAYKNESRNETIESGVARISFSPISANKRWDTIPGTFHYPRKNENPIPLHCYSNTYV